MSGYQTILQISALAGFWGAFAANAIFPDTSNLQWQLPVIVQFIPGAFLLLGALLIPETPQYLASKEKWTAVAESLAWLRQHPQSSPEITGEVHEVQVAAELNAAMLRNQKHVSFFNEAMKKPIRRRLGVGIGLMIAQNMVGLNALNYCMLSGKPSSQRIVLIPSRCSCHIQVCRFRDGRVSSLPDRPVRYLQTDLRHCVHVCLRQDARQPILAETWLCHLWCIDVGSR